jgi:hypothetical protein
MPALRPKQPDFVNGSGIFTFRELPLVWLLQETDEMRDPNRAKRITSMALEDVAGVR